MQILKFIADNPQVQIALVIFVFGAVYFLDAASLCFYDYFRDKIKSIKIKFRGNIYSPTVESCHNLELDKKIYKLQKERK